MEGAIADFWKVKADEERKRKVRDLNVKDPFCQIRHDPKIQSSLIIYHNIHSKIPDSPLFIDRFRVPEKIHEKLDSILKAGTTDKDVRETLKDLKLAFHCLDKPITEFSHLCDNDKPGTLDHLISTVNHENGTQTPANGWGSVGFVLQGVRRETEHLFVATSGHVILSGQNMHNLNSAKDPTATAQEIATTLSESKEVLGTTRHINTNFGDIDTVNPPAFTYREWFIEDEQLDWFDRFLQDMALLQIGETEVELGDDLLDAHENSEIEGVLRGEKLTIKEGILGIESEYDIERLEARQVKIVAGQSYGHLVMGPHNKLFKQQRGTPIEKTPVRLASRLHFVVTKKG